MHTLGVYTYLHTSGGGNNVGNKNTVTASIEIGPDFRRGLRWFGSFLRDPSSLVSRRFRDRIASRRVAGDVALSYLLFRHP